jgi:hypothetical protein
MKRNRRLRWAKVLYDENIIEVTDNIFNNGRRLFYAFTKRGDMKRIYYARFKMEVKLGRKLKSFKEIVHHKDGNPLNDEYKNLQVLTRSEHSSLTHKGKIIDLKTRRKISKTLTGHICSKETKRKMSIAATGKIFTEEHKENIRKSWDKRRLIKNEQREGDL